MRRFMILSLAALAIAGTFASLRSDSAVGSSPSPLAAYPGFGHDSAGDEARFGQEAGDRENRIAACMNESGFRYFPSPPIKGDGALTKQQLWALVEQDANRQYAQSLSPERARAYSLALAGVPDANDPGLDQIAGCIGEAHREVPGVFAAYGALLLPFEELQAEIASDARVVVAEERWAACMRDGGFAFRTPRDLRSSPEERRNQAQSPAESARLKKEAARGLDRGASCEESTGLKAAITSARIEHEGMFVNRYREVLERYRS